jgi:ribulose-phosphate 3-epimerase
MGTKGTSMEPTIFDKIREARAEIDKYSAKVEIQVDGGIRRNTVPQIAKAGANWIVPGSLMFSEDPAAMRQWLGSL